MRGIGPRGIFRKRAERAGSVTNLAQLAECGKVKRGAKPAPSGGGPEEAGRAGV
jgi:hypothetical protein